MQKATAWRKHIWDKWLLSQCLQWQNSWQLLPHHWKWQLMFRYTGWDRCPGGEESGQHKAPSEHCVCGQPFCCYSIEVQWKQPITPDTQPPAVSYCILTGIALCSVTHWAVNQQKAILSSTDSNVVICILTNKVTSKCDTFESYWLKVTWSSLIIWTYSSFTHSCNCFPTWAEVT